MERRNYPLLIGLFIVQVIVLYDLLGNLSNPYWFEQKGWSSFALSSFALLLMLIELSGLLRTSPREVMAAFSLYLLALLAIDMNISPGSDLQSPFFLLLASLIALSYVLGSMLLFKEGPYPLIGTVVGLGLVYAYVVLQWRDQPVAVASLFAGWLIWLIGGFSALGKRDEKGTLYAVGSFVFSVLLVVLSMWLIIMTMGFSSSY